jgi:RNA polymerase sigma factor (TIGR02999 family)
MRRFRQGDSSVVGQLVSIFYPQLRKLAGSRMKREAHGHTWQPTVLIHELYLELLRVKTLRGSQEGEDERAAFLKLAAHMMRRLLIHHSRPIAKQVTKEELAEERMDSTRAHQTGLEELQEIESALGSLATIDPRLRTVVELRVFEGLTGDEIAERMGCSRVTAIRHWNFARNWLETEFAGSGGSSAPATQV